MLTQDFMGLDNNTTGDFIGIVEECSGDPLALARVKVRVFGIHPEDTSLVPTKDLPWASVLRAPTNLQMPVVNQGDTVLVRFLDGKTAQYPIIIGIIPTINRPSNPNLPGNSSTLPRTPPLS